MDKNTSLNFIRNYQQNAPVDILSIAKDLGISVYTAEDPSNQLAGKIIKDSKLGGKSGYAIFVNASDPSSRQRFTIAHELAHYILHKDEIGDGLVDDALYRSGLTNKQEIEANKLAADILMPWHLINPIMDDQITSIKELASKFRVSESAMSIRLGIPSR